MGKRIWYSENEMPDKLLSRWLCENSRFSKDINCEYSRRKRIIHFVIQNKVKYVHHNCCSYRNNFTICIMIPYLKIQESKLQWQTSGFSTMVVILQEINVCHKVIKLFDDCLMQTTF